MRPLEVFPLTTFFPPTSPTSSSRPSPLTGGTWVVSPWDVRAAGRGAVLTCAFLVLAVVVTAATDEGGVSLADRCARVLPLTPACAAMATWLALSGARRASEVRALEALGRRPFDAARPPAFGAAAVGVVVALVVAIDGRVDVSGFFPVLHANGPYTFDAGVFTNRAGGWSIAADGSVVVASAASGSIARAGLTYARQSAALVVALGSVGFAFIIAAVGRARLHQAAIALFVTTLLSVVAFQAAAVGRVPTLVTVVPGTMLLGAVGWVIVRGSSKSS